MPIYGYYCDACGYEFDDLHRIDDRHKPTKKACPSCKKRKVKLGLGSFNICDPIRMGITQPSSEFKQVLEQIHTTTVGSKLDQKLSKNLKRKRGHTH